MKQGKLPFRHEGDRISKYGKGFSNLLHMVGNSQNQPVVDNSGFDSQLMNHRPSQDDSIYPHEDSISQNINTTLSEFDQ